MMTRREEKILLKNASAYVKKINKKIQFLENNRKNENVNHTYILGQAYFRINKTKKALSIYKNYIDENLKSDTKFLSQILPLIRFQAIFFRLLGDYRTSTSVLLYYIPILKKNKNWDELGNFSGNLAAIYKLKKKYVMAKRYNFIAIRYHKKSKNPDAKNKISANYCQLATIALLVHNQNVFKRCILSSRQYSSSRDSLANVEYVQSIGYVFLKKYDLAEQTLMKALYYAKGVNNYSLIRTIIYTLSKVKLVQKNNKEFYRYTLLTRKLDNIFRN